MRPECRSAGPATNGGIRDHYGESLIMKTILVIDDELLVRDTIRLTLEAEGYAVQEAKDGAEGIKMFAAMQPDLVITDIIMPNKEGIETIAELRRLAPDAKILAISGGGRIGNLKVLDFALKLGANKVLQKPVKPDVIVSTVRSVLG